MRNPFRRHRLSERLGVELGVRPSGTRRGRAANGSDRQRHLGFPQPFTEPDTPALMREVEVRIAAAVERGAFDEGSGGFLDAWILSLLDGWLALLESEHRQREDVAGWIIAARRENQVRAVQTLHRLQSRRARVDAEVERHRATVTGDEPAEPVAPPLAPHPLTAIRAVGDTDEASASGS